MPPESPSTGLGFPEFELPVPAQTFAAWSAALVQSEHDSQTNVCPETTYETPVQPLVSMVVQTCMLFPEPQDVVSQVGLSNRAPRFALHPPTSAKAMKIVATRLERTRRAKLSVRELFTASDTAGEVGKFPRLAT